MISLLGWIATAAFAVSYFFKQPELLRRIQAGAALLWIVYGVTIGAAPVVVANLLVAAAAIYSSLRRSSASRDGGRMAIAVESETAGIGRIFEDHEL